MPVFPCWWCPPNFPISRVIETRQILRFKTMGALSCSFGNETWRKTKNKKRSESCSLSAKKSSLNWPPYLIVVPMDGTEFSLNLIADCFLLFCRCRKHRSKNPYRWRDLQKEKKKAILIWWIWHNHIGRELVGKAKSYSDPSYMSVSLYLGCFHNIEHIIR